MSDSILERIAVLRNEVAGLRREDDLYRAKRPRTTLDESLQHEKRLIRIHEILEELRALISS